MTGYSIPMYGEMIADKERTSSYAQAIRDSIQIDDVVVDIGAGTGILSFLACQFGAGHVYAIEPDDSVRLAMAMSAANQFSDRVTFFQELSTKVTLPQSADLVVSDLHGILPLLEHHIPAVIDARTRFLKPTGTLIPQEETLWVAPVESPQHYQYYFEPWLKNNYDLDMQAAVNVVTNSLYKADFTSEQCLSEPQCWATLDYKTIDSPHVVGEVSCNITRDGTAHGLAMWFDSMLVPGVFMSNAPGGPGLIYGHAFFPWLEPVALAEGDCVQVKVAANLVGKDYIWRWESKILDSQSNEVKAHFKQSTFMNSLIAPSKLRKKEASFVPELSRQGEIDQFVLNEMSRSTPLGQIAELICSRFPDQFSNYKEALTHAGKLSQHYSR